MTRDVGRSAKGRSLRTVLTHSRSSPAIASGVGAGWSGTAPNSLINTLCVGRKPAVPKLATPAIHRSCEVQS
eukprot:COSAG06_NODE_1962_length_7974_cov_4.871111_5_plen_72_part_00